MKSQIEQALEEGYSHDEVMQYLSKKDSSMAPKIQQAQEEGYSSEEVLEYLGGPKQKPQSQSRDIINLEKGVGRKAGRLVAQALPVAADVASLPLTGAIMGAQGIASFAEKNRLGAVERNKWRQENPEEAQAQKRKSDPYGFGEYLDIELEKQQKGIDEKGIIPEWFSDQDWTPGGLVKTALEKAGVDMEPEDIAETAVKWATAVKNPKQLGSYLRNPAKIIQSPQRSFELRQKPSS